MEKALITGIGGFMGSHLADFLVEKNMEVYGTYFKPTTNIKEINEKVKLFECDIRDKEKLKKIIKEVKPDKIFHLAAQSYPAVSWDKAIFTLESNIIGSANLFEIIRELKIDPKVLVACSSAEYGFVKEDEVPVKEEHNLKPLHPYGVSKVATEMLAYQYYKNFNIKAIIVRIFNTTGPKKVNDVCSDFTKRVVMAERGLQNVVKVGSLEPKRAIMDVRDAVKAFWLLMDKGKFGVAYNLSGSKAYKIKDILDKVLELSKVEVKVEQDKNLLRPSDEAVIIGDSSKLKETTGWEQEIPIEKTLQDMLDYWRGGVING